MNKRVHIIYSGAVQGVGFRFTAQRVAMPLNLTGWVRNVPDGTVEVVAEGEEQNLVNFIDKVKKAMKNYMRGTKVDWEEYREEFDSFGIKFY